MRAVTVTPIDGWSPDQYEQFRAERQQPFDDLLRLCGPVPGGRVVDLGCGTGDLTKILHETSGADETVGIDASPAMLARAQAAHADVPGLSFASGDIATWLDEGLDLVFANASLQWVDDHLYLLARMRTALGENGQLAFQVPANYRHPSHLLAQQVANEPPFMTVANLRPEKGYDVLLTAARSIADYGLPIRIAAVGRGPLATSLRARHNDLSLGERFQFLGQRDDVLQLLAGADAFVLPSLHEGLPVALMEATSVGLPIVASSVGGVPQVLEDGVDALLVPPGEPGSLVDAMKRLASDPELRERLGRQAKLRSSMFDIAEAGRAVGDIYLRVARAR